MNLFVKKYQHFKAISKVFVVVRILICFLVTAMKDVKIWFYKFVYIFVQVLDCFNYMFTTDMVATLHEKITSTLCDCGFQLMSLSTDYTVLVYLFCSNFSIPFKIFFFYVLLKVDSLNRCEQLFLALIKHDTIGEFISDLR